MNKHILAVGTLAMALTSVSADAASSRENRGVIGGAVVGAVAGGPIGLIAGAALGGHYAGRSERLHSARVETDRLTADLDRINAELSASTIALEQVEQALAQRNARLIDQNARIDSLVEDQILLSALKVRVRFATGDADLSEDDHETLALLGRYLQRHPELRVQLDGHADSRGPAKDNQMLSEARVQAVSNVLEGSNIDETRMDRTAHGERHAVAGADDHDTLAAERRVDVKIVPAPSAGAGAAKLD